MLRALLTSEFDHKRLFTAFTLTPLLSGFYPAIFLAEPSVMPIGLVLAYVSAALFGVPLIVVFDRQRWRSWWAFACGGVAVAVPTMMLYAITRHPEHLQAFGPLPALGVLAWGGCSGIVFWLLGVAGDTPVNLRSLFDPLPPKH